MQDNKQYTVQYDWETIVAGIRDKNIIFKLLPNSKLSTDYEKNLKINYGILSLFLEKNSKARILETLLKSFETLAETLKRYDITLDYNQLVNELNKEQEQDMPAGFNENLQTFGPAGFNELIPPQNDSSDFLKNFVSDIENARIAEQIINNKNGATEDEIKNANAFDKKLEQEYQKVKNSSNMKDLLENIKIVFEKIQKALGLNSVISPTDIVQGLKEELTKQNYTKGGFKEIKQELIQSDKQLQNEKQQMLWNKQFDSGLKTLDNSVSSKKKLNEDQIKIVEQTLTNTLIQSEKQLQEKNDQTSKAKQPNNDNDLKMRQKKLKENDTKIAELSFITELLNGITKNNIVQLGSLGNHFNKCTKDIQNTIDYSNEVALAYSDVYGSKDKASLIKNFEYLLDAINTKAKELSVTKGDIITTEYFKTKLEKGLASIEGNFSEIKTKSEEGLKNAKDANSKMMKERLEKVRVNQKLIQKPPEKGRFSQHANKQLKEKQSKQNSNQL